MPTAFVTGGSGFVGGALLRRLASDGWQLHALARSDRSAEVVADAGAEVVRGDLDDVASMRAGAKGCDYAFHAAAFVGEWGRRSDYERANVTGTRNVLDACRSAGVRRLVHVSTEGTVLAGKPLVNVDETAPLRPDSKVAYCATKARAEEAVRAASGGDFETVAVRPRFVWGRGDTNILPLLVEAVRRGRFGWIGGGTHRMATTHVENVVHGLVLGAEHGGPGEAYFISDGEAVVFRDFVTRLLETQGLHVPDRSAPRPVAAALAGVGETLWRLLPLPGAPPLTRMALWVSTLETTLDISKARSELGYDPIKSIDEGLAELREDAAALCAS